MTAELASGSEPSSRIRSQFTSKSGRLVVELRATYGPPTEVWIGPASNRKDRQLLFDQEDELEVSAQISDNDRLVLVLWGGGSAGHHIELFSRDKSGKYKRQNTDLSMSAWELARRSNLVPASASPAHLRCFPLKMPTNPLSVVFRLVGNYLPETGPQTNFGPIHYRYTVGSRKLDIVPVEPESTVR